MGWFDGVTFVTGVTPALSVAGYCRVGHNSSVLNNDAVFSLTPRGIDVWRVTSVAFYCNWNNTAAGTGWSGSYVYICAVSTDSSYARNAYSGTHLGKSGVTLSGSSGTVGVVVSGLSLVPDTTYYARLNFNGSTYSTMKAFTNSGQSCGINTQENAGTIAMWNGSSWVQGYPYIWNGGSWVRGYAFVWDGANWLKGH